MQGNAVGVKFRILWWRKAAQWCTLPGQAAALAELSQCFPCAFDPGGNTI